MIGSQVLIIDHAHGEGNVDMLQAPIDRKLFSKGPIVIEDNVWIGINAIILKGVRIGEGAVIAAGAIVTKDCEPYGVYAGIPAKKVGVRQQNLDYDCTGFAYFHNIRKPYFS